MRHRYWGFSGLVGLTLFASATAVALADGAQAAPTESLHDRLVMATYNSSLDVAVLKPWHLKLDVTFYDAEGRNPYSGTIETWHSGDDSRTVISVGPAVSTMLRVGGNVYSAQSGPNVPTLTDFILDAILHPGPTPGDVENALLRLHKESFGKVKLDCIMLAQPIAHVSSPIPIGLFPTYCLDPGSDNLRTSYNLGSVSVLLNGVGSFQGKEVATDISLVQDKIRLAEAKVATLHTFVPADDFKPDPGMEESTGHPAKVEGRVLAGSLLTKVTPAYPVSARREHIGGTVLLQAVIGRDGHIHSLRTLSTPDVDLAISAIAAVRQWTYTPYLLNGRPVEVSTTITVNYNLNR